MSPDDQAQAPGTETDTTTEETRKVSETLLEVSVPRKKRVMKKKRSKIKLRENHSSSIDLLAEVLAEKCGGSEEPESSDEDEDEDEEDDEEREGGSSKKKHHLEPYKFTRCKLKNRHFLREGQGLAMIRCLGLEQFLLHTEVPTFNRSYCTEFITSYNHNKGSGVVRGKVIIIDAEAVRRVTGLPLGARGDRGVIHDVRGEDIPIMERLIPGLKRTSYGYDLRYLRFRDQTETFVAVASSLSEKLVCRTFKLTYIKGAIILAMESSLRLKIHMQWADFMAETMRSAIKLTKMRTRNVRFAFGEWLSGIIEDALSDAGRSLLEPEKLEDDHLAPHDPGAQVLPLVVAEGTPLQPQKFKRSGKAACSSGDESQIVKLQQQLEEAERRERWFIAMNLSMAREMEKMKAELSELKGKVELSELKEKGKPGGEASSSEMQLVVKGENHLDQSQGNDEEIVEEVDVKKMLEHLERRNSGHEGEVLRLREEVEEQKRFIEVVKRSLSMRLETDSIDLEREQKRLRREYVATNS